MIVTTITCENCEIEFGELISFREVKPVVLLCLACTYLLTGPVEYVGQLRSNGETEKFFNRRWSMRFNRGEIPEQTDGSTLWQRKLKEQDW